jgi:site-specific DNA-methyltransferase (adenine-specific)
MGDESVDLVVTDPPYGINYKTNHRKDKGHRFNNAINNDADVTILNDVIDDIWRVMKQNTAFYCFCSSDAVELVKPIIARKFKIKNTIIWVKNNWTAGDLKAQFGKQYEMIIYANKGRRLINGRRDPDVWFHDRVVGRSQVHQNQKPLDLIKRIVSKSSSVGDLVFDPFMGSGTTAVACLETGRRYVGFENDLYYYDVAMQRIGVFNAITEEVSAGGVSAAGGTQ